MITVFFGAFRITYSDATYVYEHEGAFYLSNGPKELHGPESGAKIYALIPTVTPCVIQNDDAAKTPTKPRKKKAE